MSIPILSKCLKPLTINSISKILILKRYSSRRPKCAEYLDPVCSKKSLKRHIPCPTQSQGFYDEPFKPKPPSMWENPQCCTVPCPTYFPRFDELYYESSALKVRKIQQTWVSFPALKYEKVKLCSPEKAKYTPMEKRNIRLYRKKKIQTACPIGTNRDCMKKKIGPCPKVFSPGCTAPRQRPLCKVYRPISGSPKECTPYPSYSECLRAKTEQVRKCECKCLNKRMLCEMWLAMRHRMTIAKC